MLPEQLHEATRPELLLRLLKRAARDHGPAAFQLGDSAEDSVIADAILGAGASIAVLRGARADAAALAEKNALITSARGEAVPPYEYDAALGVLKFNPLADWCDADVEEYLAGSSVSCLATAAHSGERRNASSNGAVTA